MNYTKAILHLYPTARPEIDFLFQDDSDGNGPYIAKWTLSQPKPTEAELIAAWNAIKDLPPPKTQQQKEIDKLTADNEQMNLQIIDLFEQLVTKGVL